MLLRTFLPGVDINDSRDSFRHRWLSTASLANLSDARIARTLGSIARSQTELRPLPRRVTRLHRAFERLPDRELSDAVWSPVALSLPTRTSPAPASRETTHPDPASAYEQLNLVKEVFGLDEIDRTALMTIAEAATSPRVDVEVVDRLDARLASLRKVLAEREYEVEIERARAESNEVDAAIAEQDAADARNEAVWLRRQLQEQGAHEIAWASLPESSRPANMLELVDSLPERVIFTGDTKDVEDVVERDGLQTCTVVAWDAVNAMHDYLRARDAEVVDCSFHRYLIDTPSGYRTLSPRKSAENETSQTQRGFGDERSFRVPASVSPSGRITMNAHIKLGRIGMASPRLHYFHDHEGRRIYIGYIGLHLTNTKTN